MKLKIKKQNVLLKLILLISFVVSGCATDGRHRIFTMNIETSQAWPEGHPDLISERELVKDFPLGRKAQRLRCAGNLDVGGDATVARGWLGTTLGKVTPGSVPSFELKDNIGALVKYVYPDGPAGKVGIKIGDVITKFNGIDVNNDHFGSRMEQSPIYIEPILIENTSPGTEVDMEVVRSGKLLNLKTTLVALKDNCYVESGAPDYRPPVKISGPYRVALIHLVQSQIIMAKALGLDKHVIMAENNLQGLQGGDLGAKVDVSKIVLVTGEVRKAVSEEAKKKTVLSAHSKALFMTAIPHYIKGTQEAWKISKEGVETAKSMNKFDWSLVGKVIKVGETLVGLPTLLDQLSATSSAIREFMFVNKMDDSSMKSQLAGIY